MNRREFERVVIQAIDDLPVNIRRQIVNVAIVVEDLPDDETLEAAGVDEPYQLLGFYSGIPLTERSHDYGLVPPDKITIFRKPILLRCRTDGEARAAVSHTLRHELAHYFGLSDDRLEELGAY